MDVDNVAPPEVTVPDVTTQPYVAPDGSAARTVFPSTSALRDPQIPEFTGEGDRESVRAWLSRLELELLDHGIAEERWSLAAIRRFPIGSRAQVWGAALYGHGRNFSGPEWGSFRKALTAHFGSPAERLEAEAGWVNLHRRWMSDPVKNVTLFTEAMDRLTRARAEDDAPQESMETLMWAYRSRLDGTLALHIEKLVNDHRTMTTMWGGNTTSATSLTITDLLQATLEWARQTPGKTVGQTSRTAQIGRTSQLVAQTAASTTSQPPPLPTDTTPMDIDAIVLAVMRAQEAAKKDAKKEKKDRGARKDQGKRTIKCYACGKAGHIAREYPNVRQDGEAGKE